MVATKHNNLRRAPITPINAIFVLEYTFFFCSTTNLHRVCVFIFFSSGLRLLSTKSGYGEDALLPFHLLDLATSLLRFFGVGGFSSNFTSSLSGILAIGLCVHTNAHRGNTLEMRNAGTMCQID